MLRSRCTRFSIRRRGDTFGRAAEIFQVEKVESHRAVALLHHDVGFLEVAGVDAGVVHAAKFGCERIGDRLAARVSVARFAFAPEREMTQDLRVLERLADEIAGAHGTGSHHIHRSQRLRAMKSRRAQNLRAVQRSRGSRTGGLLRHALATSIAPRVRLMKTAGASGQERNPARVFPSALTDAERGRVHQLIGLLDERRHFRRRGVKQASTHRGLSVQDSDAIASRERNRGEVKRPLRASDLDARPPKPLSSAAAHQLQCARLPSIITYLAAGSTTNWPPTWPGCNWQ